MAFSRTTKKQIKANNNFLKATLIPLAGLILFFMLITLSRRFIYIYDGDKVIAMKTYADVGEVNKFLYKNGIKTTLNDLVEVSDSNFFTKEIKITRAFPVKVTADGGTTTMMLRSGHVGSVLNELNISVDGDDLLNYDLSSKVFNGMEIVVHRVSYSTEVTNKSIPYSVKQIKDPTIPAGKTIKVTSGANGILEVKAQNKYIDGALVESKQVYQKVVKQPVSGVVKYGTWGIYTSRGENFRYSRVLEVTATAYTFAEVGSHTATGKHVQVGFVAVDPKVIPLGSRLFIISPSGNYIYGYAVAEDTGGAIKGLRIDVFLGTMKETRQFGRRKMKVYILSEG